MKIAKIARGTTLLDIEHLQRSEVIGCCLLERGGRLAIIDPGPASGLDNLVQGLEDLGVSLQDLDCILLTHIHLDHAGATGSLLRRNPALTVHVHERGTRHLVDPSRLMESARRVFGDDLDRLWGVCEPVPAENIRELHGDERIQLGNCELEVVYTPGHASHHVSFFDDTTGIAFVGDTGGIRISNRNCILPVTPAPDIDLEAWRHSISEIRRRQPAQIVLTHFGPAFPVDDHLDRLLLQLELWEERVQEQLRGQGRDSESAKEFGRLLREDVLAAVSAEDAEPYEIATGSDLSWYGMARYLRMREKKEPRKTD